MIDLGGMALFVRVVQSGGVSAAARALNLPKSTVSRQLAALEQRLGVPLLRRNTRSISLTEAGETFYRRCLAIVADAEAAEAEVLAQAASPRGVLRLTATIGFGNAVLHPLICDYLSAYPDVRVDLFLTDQRVNLIRDGFDLAIRMGALDDSELTARRLAAFERVLCASPAYLDRAGRPALPADLERHDCLVVQRDLATWRFASDAGEASVHVPWRMCVNHIDIIRKSACAGHGIANLPRYVVAADLATGALEAVLPGWRQRPVDVTAVYPAGKTPSPPTRALLDLMIARLPGMQL